MSELRLARSARELRDELEELIRDDLIGPIGGPEEELEDAPVDRYLLGLLAPRFTLRPDGSDGPAGRGEDDGEDPIAADALPEDGLADGGDHRGLGRGGDGRGSPAGGRSARAVVVRDDVRARRRAASELRATASWGAYARQTSEQRLDRDGKPARVWQRRPCGGEQVIV